MSIIANSIDRILERIKARNTIVSDGHISARSHIVLRVDDFTITANHDLINSGKVAIVQSLGRIGPRNCG